MLNTVMIVGFHLSLQGEVLILLPPEFIYITDRLSRQAHTWDVPLDHSKPHKQNKIMALMR